MKVGILTLPLNENYGGILQAYALSQLLNQMGHQPVLLNRCFNQSLVKRIVWEIVYALHIPPFYMEKHRLLVKGQNQMRFVQKYMNRTCALHSGEALWKECQRRQLSAVIVGSDQVWRTDYAVKVGYNYFLDFLPVDAGVKRLSYAASLGLNTWNYDETATAEIKKLLGTFNGISVREDEGKVLLKKNVASSSEVVLDPTLLLSSENYKQVMSPRLRNNYTFVYWLGEHAGMIDVLHREGVAPERRVEVELRSEGPKPAIEDWLSYINYADEVITDSFHGCVYAIVLQKQFKVYINKSGGGGRLRSLLQQLGIEKKLEDVDMYVDYEQVNQRLRALQEQSVSFLSSILHD